MILTLKGEKREFENGLNLLDIAGQINQQLKKDALCAKVDGTVVELWHVIDRDCEVEFHLISAHRKSAEDAQPVKRLTAEARFVARRIRQMLDDGTPVRDILIPSPNVAENHQYHNGKVIQTGVSPLLV